VKSYNTRALRGEEGYDDVAFQKDMRGSEVHIPDNLLFSPRMNDYVLDEMRKKNIQGFQGETNPQTGKLYTPEEARRESDQLHTTAKKQINDLY